MGPPHLKPPATGRPLQRHPELSAAALALPALGDLRPLGAPHLEPPPLGPTDRMAPALKAPPFEPRISPHLTHHHMKAPSVGALASRPPGTVVRSRRRRSWEDPMNLETVMTRSHDVRSRFKRSWQHPIHLEIVMTRDAHVRSRFRRSWEHLLDMVTVKTPSSAVRSRFKGSEHQPD